MNIVILMSVWCQNLWDELILKNEINLLNKKYPFDNHFRVFSYDIKNPFFISENIEYIEYFPIWIKKIWNLFRNIKNYYNFIKTIKWAEKVIIWWGGIMFDNEIWDISNPLNQWLFRIAFINFLKKDIIFYWLSIDIKDQKNLKKIKRIFSVWTEIYVRDKHSFELLQNLQIKSQIILDPVFYDNQWSQSYLKPVLEIKTQDFNLENIKDIDFNKKTVWLSFRKWYLKDEIKLINEIVDFILNNWWKIILLPHSFHIIDEKSNDFKFLQQFLKSGVAITSSMQETYEIYKNKKINFCLSMRLHSMILCQVYNIDFVSLKYSTKCDLI